MSGEILRLRDKANKFNEHRIISAQALMNKDELNVFQTFPLLFHFNLPTLPGYIKDDIPTGIEQFDVTDSHRQLINSFLHTDLPESAPIKRDIIGLYAMGSTASIGQSSESDFDIWVCYPHQLDSKRVRLLEDKSWLITHWAESWGVELNFFLIPDNKFRITNDAHMTKDACGTSQHMLLLDEFYRTALRVAGKSILWRLIPIEHEQNYDRYVQALYDSGTLNKEDWLDLGGFHRIPAEEYFGATLWQLYKGIDTPYKAVLKSILMEAYSWEYPKTELIAITYKKRFLAIEEYDERLDPYCLMLDKVTDYLTSINDFKRLEIVRACFYLKTEVNLSQIEITNESTSRENILARFVRQWKWNSEQIADLDNRINWKVNDVAKAKDILLDTIMTSYRKLLSFARDNNIGESISAEDIGILSRKLYAAHETLPGKVDLINPNISPDLSEPHISFIQVPEGHTNPAGWYLYNSSLETHSLIRTSSLMHGEYISKLVSWCHMNGLYEEDTELHLYNQGSDLVTRKLNQFIQDLYAVFPVYVPKATNQALSQPCEIKHLCIFLNVEKDPTRHWQDAHENPPLENDNILSYGQNKECLIGSVDLIYRNSWNEIRTLHFDDEFAVVESLNTILGKMHQDAVPPQQIDLFCYSQHFQEQISKVFKNKLEEYIQLRLDSLSQRSVQTLWTGGRKFGFYFERTGVSLQQLQNTVDIYSHISKKKVSNSAINLKNTFFENTAKVIESHISEGLIQFFFENYAGGFNVYIANADNEVESFQSFAGSKDDLVQNVNRFYSSNSSKSTKSDRQINFNLPQFYEIGLDENDKLSLSPFKSRCKGAENNNPS